MLLLFSMRLNRR